MTGDREGAVRRRMQSGGCPKGVLRLAVALVVLQFVPSAAAHAGTTHAGTPHWLLLAVLVLGVALAGLAVRSLRRGTGSARTGAIALLSGLVLAGIGTIGLVEIQVEAAAAPSTALLAFGPAASYVVGFAVVLGSQAFVLRYWPERPHYLVLGAVLGAWILYPVLMPRGGIRHPLGYALVLALPLTLAYTLRRDAGGAVRSVLADRFARRVAVVSGAIVCLLLSFSAGTLTVVPETTGVPDEPFLVAIGVADPLVLWPAVEFYLPSIPVFGMLSVGTVVLFGTLSTLMGLNVALVADELRARRGGLSPGFLLGTVSTTGATACGCCAPALYGVLSATLGASATPIYWSFMDTSSPLSGTFLAASVLLLTASVVRAAGARSDGGGPGGPAAGVTPAG